MMRLAVKKILHLPESTLSDHFLYVPIREGGLGFQSVREQADFNILSLYLRFERSSDPIGRLVAGLYTSMRRKSRLIPKWKFAMFTEKGLAEAKSAAAAHHKTACTSTYQAIGFREFREACSNKWIHDEKLTERNYIGALKARTSLVSTRLQILRGRAELGDQRVKCRRWLYKWLP
ncbi:hypothetical protein M514_05600 [Trichuris suis]|uniref:Uncharacterized protein n=1 Tax=Trichuris suis TaxID=68888 RepID=A0A085NQT9_9BILA|nr:hypothetical protein M513_05600 [Trichuris suis]KFD71835.1 hypothetical protein M514_05600 [Trichuris suis]